MPKATLKRTPRKTTKAEVQKEFAEIAADVEEAAETADEKRAEASRVHDSEVRQAVEGITVDNVITRISALGLDVNKALAGISEKLTEEVHLLSSVREAIAIEQTELARLHKIDVAATALDQMVQDYRAQKQRLEEEIGAQRAVWELERQTTERERREQEDALRKQRQRENEDFEYRKAQERKKAQDKYDEEQRQLERRNQERQEALDKGWAARENALKEREQELERLRRESDTFPARLAKETEAAATRAAKEVEAKFEEQILLSRKDAEAERRMAELRIQSLDQVISSQAAQVALLEKQLAEAKAQVQEIAVKAIEGASGARALAHVNQIAIEQAKNRPQS